MMTDVELEQVARYRDMASRMAGNSSAMGYQGAGLVHQIMELHKPIEIDPEYPERYDYDQECEGCDQGGGSDAVRWPCSTAKLILEMIAK